MDYIYIHINTTVQSKGDLLQDFNLIPSPKCIDYLYYKYCIHCEVRKLLIYFISHMFQPMFVYCVFTNNFFPLDISNLVVLLNFSDINFFQILCILF